MKICFLGTGTSQGVPIIGCTCPVCTSSDKRDKRLRSSVHIEFNDRSLVIDTGPDFRYQMLRAGVSSLDAILFTHEHKDHVAGLDDIRPFNYLKQQVPDVFCTEAVETALRRDFYYAFDEPKYPGVPEFRIHRIENKPFIYAGETIVPIQVYHHKMPVLGFRIGDFAYITDANYIPEEEFTKLEGLKYFVINALRRTEHISHFSLHQAMEIAQRIAAEQTLLTHISHQLPAHAELSAELPANIQPAHDGLILEL
ncbi:MAG: MBL fold metallo-hydrolase [Bacteroidia bacterium]|nr:MBL fold metallo-hydrolase [Bacteroidia bacterium]